MFVVGTEPGLGVRSDTKLIKDTILAITQLYDKQSLTIQFPEVFRQLQGSDTKIEIITSSMLQPMRMNIKGFQIKEISVYVLVQTHLQMAKLPKITYLNSEKRASEVVAMFRDELMIDPSKITFAKNYSKDQMLSLLDQIQKEADDFQNDKENDSHSVKTIIVSYIGFKIDSQCNPYI